MWVVVAVAEINWPLDSAVLEQPSLSNGLELGWLGRNLGKLFSWHRIVAGVQSREGE